MSKAMNRALDGLNEVMSFTRGAFNVDITWCYASKLLETRNIKGSKAQYYQ